MIENTLQRLLANMHQLGSEFDIEQLNRNHADIDNLLASVKIFFKDNMSYADFFHSIDTSDLTSLLDDMIEISVVYAYYFVLDYLVFQKNEPCRFNFEYIKKALSPNATGDDAREFYNNNKKPIKKFLEAATMQTDPLHFNPRLVAQDEKKDSKKRYHFSGQITKYFQKVFSLTPLISNSTPLAIENYKLLDLLPALTLMSIKASTLMPMGFSAQKGKYDILKIRKLCNALQYTAHDTSKDSTSKSSTYFL